MEVLIIEDETRASAQLKSLLAVHFPQVQILDIIESVEESVNWLQANKSPSLIFMDIQLADGLSFEIFESVDVQSPIIFTTAYDQYSIKAFKVNSVDYLLKPIIEKDLLTAVNKYQKLYAREEKPVLDVMTINKLINNLTEDKSRKRFIVKEGSSMTYVHVEDIAYFDSAEGITFLHTKTQKRYTLDMTLDVIEKDVNPDNFFRINRGQIIHVEAVSKIKPYFNNRLTLDVANFSKEEFIVSRGRSTEFKKWVNQ